MQNQKYKRKIIVIKKKLQFKFVSFVFVTTFIAVLLIGFDVYYTIGRHFVEIINQEIFKTLIKATNLLLLKIFFYFIFVIAIAVFLSHKIAGPIYRFEKSTQIIGSGDFTYRVRLRKSDELKELMDAFNKMIEELQIKVQKDVTLKEFIQSRLKGVIDDISSGKKSTKDIIQELENIKLQTSHIASEFKI